MQIPPGPPQIRKYEGKWIKYEAIKSLAGMSPDDAERALDRMISQIIMDRLMLNECRHVPVPDDITNEWRCAKCREILDVVATRRHR